MLYILAGCCGILVGSIIRGLLERRKDYVKMRYSSKDAEVYNFDLSGLHAYKNVYFIPLNPFEVAVMATNDTQEVGAKDLLKELAPEDENSSDKQE